MQPKAATARRPRQRHWLYAAALAVLISPLAIAQQPEFRTGPAPVSGTEGLTRLPRGAYVDEPAVGVPYSTLFRDTGAPYTNALRDQDLDPSIRGGSVDASFDLDLPDFRARFPLLDRGFAPEDADLKFGPVFFKLQALGAGLLFSDNINLSENDRESDVIGIVRLSGSLVVQLTEGFRIAAAGTLIYFPFENRIGIAGFGLHAPFSFGLGAVPALETQVTWDTMIGGWPVLIADEFRMGVGRYSISSRDDFELFEGGQFDGEDRAGRYTFRAPHFPSRGNGSDYRERDSEFIYFSNTVSATTERFFPGDIRLRVRAYHENLWYNQGHRGLPGLRQGVDALLRSERENLRFKPFLSYHALRTDLDDSFSHTVRLGVQGPITDQLDFYGSIGLFYNPDTGVTRVPWRIAFYHDAGPYTQQSLTIGSELSDFNDEFYTRVTYRLRQVLGPRLSGEAFVSYGTVEDLLGEYSSREELRTGARISALLGPRTRLNIGGTYTRIDGSEAFRLSETWTGRLELSYRFTDTLLSRLLYQYQQRDSSREDDSYYENLVYLTITKYFP